MNFSTSIILKLSFSYRRYAPPFPHRWGYAQGGRELRCCFRLETCSKFSSAMEPINWIFDAEYLNLEAAASSLGLLGRKLKQLFNSQHCFGSTSCWRLDRTASAFSDTLELFVSQSCEEFSGRACTAWHVSDGKRRFPTWQSPLQAPQSPPPTLSEVLQTSLCTPPPDQQVIVMPRILSMAKVIKSSWRNKLQAKITWR